MINIVMLVRDRPKLTHQCLTSLVKNTSQNWNLVIVDDGSKPETRDMLRFAASRKNTDVLRVENSGHVLGKLKNLGVWWSEKRWGIGNWDEDSWLYLSDNDAFFTPGWDIALIDMLKDYPDFVLVGGQNHPFHQSNHSVRLEGINELREYSALAGTSWMMSWDTWDKFGPLCITSQPGVCQSEDYEFSQRVREAGGKVGAVWPEVVIDCSLTDSEGKKALGADVKKRVEGLIYA